MKKLLILFITIISMFTLTSCGYQYKAPSTLNYVSSVKDPNIRYDKNFVEVALFTYPDNNLDAALFVRKGTTITQQQLEDALGVKFLFPYSPKVNGNYWVDENNQPFDFSKPITKATVLKALYFEQSVKINYNLNPDPNNKIKKVFKPGYEPQTSIKISQLNNFYFPTPNDIISSGSTLTNWLFNGKIVANNDIVGIKNDLLIYLRNEVAQHDKANNVKFDKDFVPEITFTASYISTPYNVTFTVPKQFHPYDKDGNQLDNQISVHMDDSSTLPAAQTVYEGNTLNSTPYSVGTSFRIVNGYKYKGWIYIDPQGKKHILTPENSNGFIIDFVPADNNIVFTPYFVTR